MTNGESPPKRRLECWAGFFFFIAAAAHGFLSPAHFEEWWGYGIFFAVAGVIQAVWGLALFTHAINPKDSGAKWRPLTTGLYVLGILGNLFTMILYVVSRTYGVPFFGPEAGVVEAVAPVDVVTKAAEGAAVILLAILLKRHQDVGYDAAAEMAPEQAE